MTREPKLSIEMIPEPLWGTNLRKKLKQSEWDKLRKACYAAAGHVCEICGGVGKKYPVVCHEIWEYDDEQHVQKLRGLVALCPACSDVKHFGRACAQGREEDARQHFLKVNGWSAEQMKGYVEEANAFWEKRSACEWTQDLNWLHNTAQAT